MKACKARAAPPLVGAVSMRRVSLSLLLSLAGFVGLFLPLVRAAPPESSAAQITGVVKHGPTGEALAGVRMVLECECLDAARETLTDEGGIYRFDDLPPGRHTVRARAGVAEIAKIVTLPRGAGFRANFAIDPDSEGAIEIIVTATPGTMSPAALDHPPFDLTKLVGADINRCTLGARRTEAAFDLQRSLLDDGRMHRLVGGPVMTRWLF